MRAVFALIVSVCGIAAIVSIGYADSATATASPGAVAVVATGLLPTLGDDIQHHYVGNKRCKMCHMAQHKSWAKTKMGKALETLRPGNAAEAKTKHGLDPEKDYTQDVTCLACHTTGFGFEGGYAVPDPADKKAVRKAKKLAGVGCESCHGPGSEYIKLHEDVFRSKRKYKVEEFHAAGMRKMDASACTACHNAKGPTVDPNVPFDFEKMKSQDAHENQPLLLRED